MRWYRAKGRDFPLVKAFVREREERATGLAARLKACMRPNALRPDSGDILVTGDSSIRGVCFLGSSGSAFPLCDAGDHGHALEGLAECDEARAYRPGACIGMADELDGLERALGWEPQVRNAYRLMILDDRSYTPSARGAPGLTVRKARADDIDLLSPLAELYEREEVLTSLHRFDPAASRAAQLRAIRVQVVYVAFSGSSLVARAQTNARGWAHDQLGGIMVSPRHRGMGFGRLVVQALVEDRLAEGRGLTLFVKETNVVARQLYYSLGFRELGAFRVDYFA